MKEARLLGTPVQRHAPRAASPLKQSSSNAEPASPTLSGTSRQPSPSPAPSQRPQPSAADLKAAAAAAVARTRIQADPSVSSAFRREDDEELWQLFTR
ncbi:hypothetical protein JCM8208_006511 [Rhodotorula glutinis]